MSEFDLIAKYFTWDVPTSKHNNIIKSVGDDAAVLSLSPNQQLVTSIDTLVAGVHFPHDTTPYDIAHKSLAVNLSDLAAMGAKPEWFTLALTIPFASSGVDHAWLSEFSRGLKTLAEEFGIALVGGDTTSGPLTISIQVMGSVETGKALYRNGAKLDDKIYVTGTLGDGAAGLSSIQNTLKLLAVDDEFCRQRLNRPTPRLNESDLIKNFASACIDVSDGLLQDLSHILEQSSLSKIENASSECNVIGAKIDLIQIPLSKALQNCSNQQALDFALTGGDDYELLFTLSPDVESQFLEAVKLSDFDFSFTCIGKITDQNGIVDSDNNPLHNSFNSMGFNHFS